MVCFPQRQCPCFSVILLVLLFLSLPAFSTCCWGETAPRYGDMTSDYDLLVGEVLVLNCTLNSNYVEIVLGSDKKYFVNSSHLTFRKGYKFSSSYVHIIDNLTAQLRIPNAKRSDSGLYYCELALPKLRGEPVVCNSKVSVGYPPKPVSNFKCISKYYENLTCTWDIADNGVQTKYILYKHHFFSSYFESPPLQQCPSETVNNTYCQWREDTDPPFEAKEKVFTFILHGNNTLGSYNQTFVINHYEIFVPSSPWNLRVIECNKQNISLEWEPPKKMETVLGKPPLQYEIWVEEIIDEGASEKRVIYVGVDIVSFSVVDLIPHMMYNFSLRCRSNYTTAEDTWSPSVYVQGRTLSDVPYQLPEIAAEAFEVHHYDGYRAVTLYWKPVPKKHFNGDDFKYHIDYYSNDSLSDNTVSTMKSVNATVLSVTFTGLQEDVFYTFRLASLNKVGISNSYSSLMLDEQDNIPEIPNDVTAISHDPGHYELSWKQPKTKDGIAILSYVVFWCSNLKPWLSRCEKPIQWLNTYLTDTKVTLNLSDALTNFQFAVAARTAKASSGLQWATCIVPYKAALGKIPYMVVEPKNSTSLKIIWRLDCNAQKAVVKKFEIVYCKVDENRHCHGKRESLDVLDPGAESFVLMNLFPFSNYSIMVRAYNLAGLPSEDSDPKFQATMQGAPADPPWKVNAIAIANASLSVSWYAPKQPNGIITHYRLCYGNMIKVVYVEEGSTQHATDVSGLSHYTNYSIKLEACVNHYCSPTSSPVIVRTDIGVPGIMDRPRVETINSTFMKVSWNKPLFANGPVDFYEIYWIEVKNSTVYEQTWAQHKVVGNQTSTMIEVACSDFEDGGMKYLFSVRAVNMKGDEVLYGDMSPDTPVTACLLSQGVAMVVGAAIGGTLALAFLMVVIYKLFKWMSEKIHQVKNITVRLPKGLDGLETNPLNNYENFKSGLVNQTLNTTGTGRLSYITDDGDKNRHGSGSSQYSYASTDELLHRNGKCTKFSRKPSESSGCSSMTSNMTKMHPSSESSSESDFMTPPSPDLVFTEQNGHKPILPILIEAQDSNEDNGQNLAFPEPNVQTSKDDCSQNDKLRIGTSHKELGIPCHPASLNSLAFYSRNLSNSEPSVADRKEVTDFIMPYSKFGLAKSSGDIITLTTHNCDLGYSRFGFAPATDGHVFPSVLNKPVIGVESPLDFTVSNGIVILPNNLKVIPSSVKKYLDEKVQSAPESISNKICANVPLYNTNLEAPLESEVGDGYIKFRRANDALPLSSGYVPLSQVNTVSKLIPTEYPLISFHPIKEKNVPYEAMSPKKESHSEELKILPADRNADDKKFAFNMKRNELTVNDNSSPFVVNGDSADAERIHVSPLKKGNMADITYLDEKQHNTDSVQQEIKSSLLHNHETKILNNSGVNNIEHTSCDIENLTSENTTVDEASKSPSILNEALTSWTPPNHCSLPSNVFESSLALNISSDKDCTKSYPSLTDPKCYSPSSPYSLHDNITVQNSSPLSSNHEHCLVSFAPQRPGNISSRTSSPCSDSRTSPKSLISKGQAGKISLKNGYVPWSTFSSVNGEGSAVVPNVYNTVQTGGENLQESDERTLCKTDMSSFESNSVQPSHNDVYTIPFRVRTNNGSISQHNVHPIINDIPKYQFASTIPNGNSVNCGKKLMTINSKSEMPRKRLMSFESTLDSPAYDVDSWHIPHIL